MGTFVGPSLRLIAGSGLTKAEKTGKLQKLLANLTKQTELMFRIEKRPVEVWFITEKKKDK